MCPAGFDLSPKAYTKIILIMKIDDGTSIKRGGISFSPQIIEHKKDNHHNILFKIVFFIHLTITKYFIRNCEITIV